MSNNLDLSQVSAAQNQKEVTINMQSAQLDAAITAQLDVPIDDGNAKTLTNNEFRRNFLFHVTEDSPAPSGAITLTVPALSRGSFAVLNLTQEDVTVTINGQPLTAPVVAPGDNPALLTCDGVNVRLASSAGGSGSGGFGTSDFNKVVTSLAVPANTAVEFNLSDFFNRGLIHTIKLTETGGNATDPYDLQFFGKDTFLSADMHYSVTGIDPTANGRLFRDDLAVMYKDLDGTDELHVKITNSDTAEAMEFTLEIDAEVFETGIGGGGGDVVGPASAVSGSIPLFDGTTGKLLKDSGRDYIEGGTFTPGISFGGASVGITYTEQFGTYTKIGNVVFILVEIILSNKGSSTGTAYVTGMPYTLADWPAPANSIVRCSNMANLAGSHVIAVGARTTTDMAMVETGGATHTNSVLNDTHFTNTSTLRLCGFFFLDPL